MDAFLATAAQMMAQLGQPLADGVTLAVMLADELTAALTDALAATVALVDSLGGGDSIGDGGALVVGASLADGDGDGDALADGDGDGDVLQASQQAPGLVALPSQLQAMGGQAEKPQRWPRQASACAGGSWRARSDRASSAARRRAG